MAEILMPKLSDSMEEGTIVRWLVADGAEVHRGEELAEIETDKATMTFEAEADGTLRILAAEGDTVAIGAAIARIGDEVVAAPAPASAPAAALAAGNGNGKTDNHVAGNGRRAGNARPKASPLARRIAQALGVELAGLAGTGPGGRIVKRDVEAAAGPEPAAPPAAAPPAAAPAPQAGPGPKGEATITPLSRTQATIARRMAEAKATMPEFTLTTDVDMDAAVALRAQLKALEADVTPSVNDLVVKACALALRRHPRANGAFRDGAFETFEHVNVGVAVAAADALLVPVVHDADAKSLGRIARDTRGLAERARTNALAPADLAGGTFSVSNLGMFGVTSFEAVLNPPQAAILAVGALERRPVVRGDAVVPGWRMTITLTCDHRILYGADAAAFLADIRAELEQPLRLTL